MLLTSWIPPGPSTKHHRSDAVEAPYQAEMLISAVLAQRLIPWVTTGWHGDGGIAIHGIALKTINVQSRIPMYLHVCIDMLEHSENYGYHMGIYYCRFHEVSTNYHK